MRETMRRREQGKRCICAIPGESDICPICGPLVFGREEEQMPRVKLNKYYVAAKHISRAVEEGVNADWTQPTLDAAIEHAKEMMETEGMDWCRNREDGQGSPPVKAADCC